MFLSLLLSLSLSFPITSLIELFVSERAIPASRRKSDSALRLSSHADQFLYVRESRNISRDNFSSTIGRKVEEKMCTYFDNYIFCNEIKSKAMS